MGKNLFGESAWTYGGILFSTDILIADYIYQNLDCLNQPEETQEELELNKGAYIGKVKRTNVQKDFKNFDASVLPKDARIYKHFSNEGRIIVDADGKLSLYVMIVFE